MSVGSKGNAREAVSNTVGWKVAEASKDGLVPFASFLDRVVPSVGSIVEVIKDIIVTALGVSIANHLGSSSFWDFVSHFWSKVKNARQEPKYAAVINKQPQSILKA